MIVLYVILSSYIPNNSVPAQHVTMTEVGVFGSPAECEAATKDAKSFHITGDRAPSISYLCIRKLGVGRP